MLKKLKYGSTIMQTLDYYGIQTNKFSLKPLAVLQPTSIFAIPPFLPPRLKFTPELALLTTNFE